MGLECNWLARHATNGQQRRMNKAGFGKNGHDGFVLFGSDRASEHLQWGVLLANVAVYDDRLFVAMDPNSTVLDHLLALRWVGKAFFDPFKDLGLIDPAFFLLPKGRSAVDSGGDCKDQQSEFCLELEPKILADRGKLAFS